MNITAASSSPALSFPDDVGLEGARAALDTEPEAPADGVDAPPDQNLALFDRTSRSDEGKKPSPPEVTITCPPGQEPGTVPVDEDTWKLICVEKGKKPTPPTPSPPPEKTPSGAPVLE
jgi:hypothetical protein